MNWSLIKCSNVGAINIPGYRKRAYYSFKSVYIKSFGAYDTYYPVVVIYQNIHDKNDVFTEILIRRPDSSIIPVPREIAERYIPTWKLNILDIGDRYFIRGKDGYGCINVESVTFALGARLLVDNFEHMLWQSLFPKVNSISAAEEVVTAYHNFICNYFGGVDNPFKNEKNDVLNKIQQLKSKIAKIQSEIDGNANESADALNELSEKFGIEVEL